jgi:hypothetical protein
VRARCERTAVEPRQVTFDEMAEYGSVMPILSVGVRWGRAIGRVCKPEATGSIPVCSIGESAYFCRYLLASSVPVPTTAARAGGASGSLGCCQGCVE